MSEAPQTLPPVLTARKLLIQLAVLGGVALAIGAACSFVGLAELSWGVWTARIRRLVVGATVGAGLATGGMALQGLLRNPLAEPYVLGISSGAGVGVLTGILLASKLSLARWATTPSMALLGAFITCLVVYGIAQRRGRLDPYALVLSGVIVNVFNGAVILSILLFFDRNEIINYIGWSMGRLPNWIDPNLLVLCVSCVAGGVVVLFIRGSAFNCFALGDEVAHSAGVSVGWLRIETFAVVAVMTAAAVALAGPVGFLGLIVPHTCRLLVGPDHRRLAVFSCFVGAGFLMLADTIGRTAGQYIGVGDIPVGILTALAGGPFFIYLLRRRFAEVPS
jgi:iron complex transport system permease protein